MKASPRLPPCESVTLSPQIPSLTTVYDNYTVAKSKQKLSERKSRQLGPTGLHDTWHVCLDLSFVSQANNSTRTENSYTKVSDSYQDGYELLRKL
jgi:hypothetical protein